jgi:hypothetical protein
VTAASGRTSCDLRRNEIWIHIAAPVDHSQLDMVCGRNVLLQAGDDAFQVARYAVNAFGALSLLSGFPKTTLTSSRSAVFTSLLRFQHGLNVLQH